MTKFNCPHCKKDLDKVGIKEYVTGWVDYDVVIEKDRANVYWLDTVKEGDFHAGDEPSEFECGNCGKDIRNYLEDKKIAL